MKANRGRAVTLQPHPEATDDVTELHGIGAKNNRPLVADLFCGAGGLSLGFERAGMTVAIGIDHDDYAITTHRAHHAGLSASWDLSDPDTVNQLGGLVRDLEISVVCGGPPCQPFSRAGRGIISSLVERGVRGDYDSRRDLWQAFLEVVRVGRPRAVLMENVPDMAFDRGMVIIRTIISELESWGYGVEAKLLNAADYGVPQMRRRLFVMAIMDGVAPVWPELIPLQVSLIDAIGDLLEIDGGWNHGALDEEGGMPYLASTSPFQDLMRRDSGSRVFDHVTRAVRADDRLAFASMEPGTKYSELDEELKRYREDIFKDKYNRLDPHSPSRTVTAHLSRDGYAYIHPTQDRTISVREAARIQSFPDDVRFAGPPTAAFKQIGNAVPVLLGEALGASLLRSISSGQVATRSMGGLTRTLADHFRYSSETNSLATPWLAAESSWQLFSAISLDVRLRSPLRRSMWTTISKWVSPQETLALSEILERLGRQLSIEEQVNTVLSIASRLEAGAQPHEIIPPSVWDMVCTLAPDEDESLMATAAMIRVAARFFGSDVNFINSGTDGRLQVMHMIGGTASDEESAFAARGLWDLAVSHCTTKRPRCGSCPLRGQCQSAHDDHSLFQGGVT